MTYQEIYAAMLEAIQRGPDEQQELVRLTDETYAFLEIQEDKLSEAEILSLRMLTAQAESMIVRYFGM